MNPGLVGLSRRVPRAWIVVRAVGAVLGFALAVRQVVWVLGAGWDGEWVGAILAIAQPIGYVVRAAPGALLGGLGALALLVVADDGSRWSRVFWVGGLVLVMLGFVVATAWVGWAPPADPYA